ncbi:Inner membrane ABC transporter permease protein YdcV [Ensifer adhaerens]|uniref:ABC transporter permease n=1 Tax=Ensifer adhaerens TaxID=106592 RepID=UPI001F330209|nr:ABC transporter permease [Ensifer adhaerens]NRP21416.1 Inner membrane ABC transporter permease protein YdcV [Ensifer adhaerens]
MSNAPSSAMKTIKATARIGDIRAFAGFGAVSVGCLIFLYAPIVFLAAYSFNDGRSVSRWSGFSFRWYATVFGNENIQTAALNSVIIAIIAATVSTLLALGAAVATVNRRASGGEAAYLVLTFPLMVPEIVTAVASLVFFVAIGISLGFVTILMAHIVFCIPFAYLPIKARLEGLDASLPAAAADLYASPARAFARITLPLLVPGLLSGWLLAFIISLDDFIITALVAGPGATTLPLHIYGMLRLGMTPEVNAISTLMLGASTVLVLVSALIGKIGHKH